MSLGVGGVALAWLAAPLRLADPVHDQFLSLLLVWVSLLGLAVASACLVKRLWARVLATAAPGLLAVLYPLGLMLSLVAGGPIEGYERLASLDLEHSTIVAYRINGGATTDFGVRVVQELRVLPGIVLARDLHRGYHERSATLRATGGASVLVTIDEKAKEYPVRPFVYF